jgi:hypothetical protein
MPKLLSRYCTIFIAEMGCQKLGQPVPDSNLVLESYNAVSQQMQRYRPSAWLDAYAPEKGRSVPARRVTSYASAESWLCQSASLLISFATRSSPVLRPAAEKFSMDTSVLAIGAEGPVAAAAPVRVCANQADRPRRSSVRRPGSSALRGLLMGPRWV